MASSVLSLGDLLQFVVALLSLLLMVAGYCFRHNVLEYMRSKLRGFFFLPEELGQGVLHYVRVLLRRFGVLGTPGQFAPIV